jgi:hypothetical protein
MKKSSSSKKRKTDAKKIPSVFVLPSANIEMETFIDKNRNELMHRVVELIGYGIEKNYDAVEVVEFDGSGYIVMIRKTDYEENLNHLFDVAMSTENYELCGKIHEVRQLIKIPKFDKKLKSINLI